jgi:hypothetical protein
LIVVLSLLSSLRLLRIHVVANDLLALLLMQSSAFACADAVTPLNIKAVLAIVLLRAAAVEALQYRCSAPLLM